MKRDTRTRRYFLTQNNPGEDWTHEKIRAALEKMKLTYWAMADEIGLEGETPHTHIYFAANSAIRFSTVKRNFPKADIEPAQGSSIECVEYLKKSGKWENHPKAKSAVPGTFEDCGGDIPIENPGERTDLARAYDLLENGADVMDVIRDNPDMIRFRSHIEQTRQDLLSEEYRTTFRLLEVTYIQGATAMGKTRHVMDSHGYENVCQITGYQHGCFDKYRGEDVLILDEFNSSFRIQDMNNYLDGYPLHLPCRYANRVACFTKVYIISNIPLELQYPNVRVENSTVWDAFIRRIHKVMVFYFPGEFEAFTTAEYFADKKRGGFREIKDTKGLPFTNNNN